MNTKNITDLLGQLLGSNVDHPHNHSKQKHPAKSEFTDGLSSLISDKGGAALAGGALGLLLGSKSGRKMGGKVLTYGGLAVLGTLAYKAYRNYQVQTTGPSQPEAQSFEQLPASEAEIHSKAILVALIAAAKADGHIDDREQQLIDQEIAKFTTPDDLRHWIGRELKKPLDPADVAKSATTETMAAEMYLASLLAVDSQNFMEKSYVDELARQMKLPPGLKAELAQQVQQAITRI
jgi:uncharacterized membrane protein YebE (DUF533 family)